jgi:hypothetical protein
VLEHRFSTEDLGVSNLMINLYKMNCRIFGDVSGHESGDESRSPNAPRGLDVLKVAQASCLPREGISMSGCECTLADTDRNQSGRRK